MAKKSSGDGKTWTEAKWALGIAIGAVLAVYLAGPDLEPKTPFVSCAICDSADQIHPPTSANETGASFTLPIENTGSLGTTLLSHNLTLRSGPEPYLSRDVGFSEIPDSNDNISVRLGAKSQVNLAILRNEVIVYSMRHGSPMGSSIGPIVHDTGYLYGHFTYRTAFYVPTTRSFCFKYVPPNKGLPESWGVCSPDNPR